MSLKENPSKRRSYELEERYSRKIIRLSLFNKLRKLKMGWPRAIEGENIILLVPTKNSSRDLNTWTTIASFKVSEDKIEITIAYKKLIEPLIKITDEIAIQFPQIQKISINKEYNDLFIPLP